MLSVLCIITQILWSPLSDSIFMSKAVRWRKKDVLGRRRSRSVQRPIDDAGERFGHRCRVVTITVSGPESNEDAIQVPFVNGSAVLVGLTKAEHVIVSISVTDFDVGTVSFVVSSHKRAFSLFQ